VRIIQPGPRFKSGLARGLFPLRPKRQSRGAELLQSIGMGPFEGDLAPDFSLAGTPPADTGDGEYTLSAQRGKVVVLAFYPGDFTPVCSRQLAHYEEQRQKLLASGCVLWAISTDKLERHERMAKSYALSFPLLADEGGTVAGLYGVRTLMGTARRAIFIIDAEGEIRFRREDPLSLTYQSVDDLLEALRASGLAGPASQEGARPQQP